MKIQLSINAERNSKIELLRCIAMLLVVMSHSSVHGNFPITNSTVTVNSCVLDWMTLGNLGTDIFVILSGWNLCTKRIKPQAVLYFVVQIWTVSVLGLIIRGLTGYSLSGNDLLRSIFPIMFDSWWFATAYLVLLLLSFGINVFVDNVTQKQLNGCLITMMVLWSIIPTFSTQDMYGGHLMQMIMLYLMGAYLRKYPNNFFSKKKYAVSMILISITFIFLSSVVIRLVNLNIMMLPFKTTMLYDRTSVLVIVCALAMVSLAVYSCPFKNKLVNTVGACTFGIYLLHEHPLIKDILWNEWVNNTRYFYSVSFSVRMLLGVIAVYGVCAFVEWLRIIFLSKPMNRIAKKLYEAVSTNINNHKE